MKQKSPKRLLGVDPGTNLLGFAVIEINGNAIQLIEIGVFTMKRIPTQQEKLRHIFIRLQAIIQRHHPQEMAIEAPFFGKNVQSMLKLGRAQGVAMAAAMMNDISVIEYSPKRIKQSVTGNGNASKEQVAAMVERLVNVSLDDYSLDATDALATAICHHLQGSSKVQKSGGRKSWSSFISENPDRLGGPK